MDPIYSIVLKRATELLGRKLKSLIWLEIALEGVLAILRSRPRDVQTYERS
jgi:hypothetical protein